MFQNRASQQADRVVSSSPFLPPPLSILLFCFSFISLLTLSSFAVAEEEPLAVVEETLVLTGEEELPTDPGQKTFRSSISTLDFEKIDPYTGYLTLTHRDVVLPGNGGLDLEIYRIYKHKRDDTGYSPFVKRWDLHFGRLRKNGTSVQIELMDGTDNTAYKPDYDSIWDINYVYLSKDHWKVNMKGTPVLQLPDGTKIIFGRGGTSTYDEWYYATEIHKNNAPPIKIHYSVNRRVSHVIDSVGRQLNFHYDPQAFNNLAAITLGEEEKPLVSYYYTENTPCYLEKVVLPDGDTWQYGYGSFGRVSSITTPYGGKVSYEYKSFHRGSFMLTSIRQFSVSKKTVAGHGLDVGTWTYDYGVKYKDSDGNRIHLDYTIIEDPCDRKTIYHFYGYSGGYDYCALYGLTREKFTINNSGSVEEAVVYTWDILEEPISKVAAYSVLYACHDSKIYIPVLTEQKIYRGAELLSKYWRDMDPAEWEIYTYNDIYITSYEDFDDYGNAQTVKEYGGNSIIRTTSTTYWYNPAENIVKNKPATVHIRGHHPFPGDFSSSYEYDYFGNVVRENKYGIITDYTYHDNGNLESSTDANGHTTWYNWQYGAVSEIENPIYAISREINPDGSVKSETSGRGYTSRYEYTSGMRLEKETPPLGNPTLYSYNFGSGSYVKTTRGGFSHWTLFDGLGREIGTDDSMGKETTISYKKCGLKESTASNIGDTTYFDNLGRVTRIRHQDGKNIFYDNRADDYIVVTNEAGKKTYLRYQTFGTPGEKYLTYVKDALGNSASFSYNTLGSLTQATFDGVTRTYEYNGKNLLTKETHPESGTTVYGRDEVGNIKTRDDSLDRKVYEYDAINRLTHITAGSHTIGYQYDNSDNLIRTGSPDGIIIYDYDENNRLTGTSTDTLGVIGQIGFGWDGNDNLTTIRYPSGNIVNYSYNNLNQVIGIDGFGSTIVAPISYYTSGTSLGLLKSFRFANGQTTDFVYNKRRAMTRTDSPVLNLGFEYGDARGNMTRLINYLDRTRDKTFTYDDVSRLQVFNGPWGAGRFDYQADGDRTRKIRGTTTAYKYIANRMSSAAGMGYDYNNDGDMIRMGDMLLDYTPFHRLWRVRKNGSVLASFGYDGNGNRIHKRVGSSAEIYLYGPGNNILADISDYGRIKREYIFLNNKLVAKIGDPDRKATVAPWLILLLNDSNNQEER